MHENNETGIGITEGITSGLDFPIKLLLMLAGAAIIVIMATRYLSSIWPLLENIDLIHQVASRIPGRS